MNYYTSQRCSIGFKVDHWKGLHSTLDLLSCTQSFNMLDVIIIKLVNFFLTHYTATTSLNSQHKRFISPGNAFSMHFFSIHCSLRFLFSCCDRNGIHILLLYPMCSSAHQPLVLMFCAFWNAFLLTTNAKSYYVTLKQSGNSPLSPFFNSKVFTIRTTAPWMLFQNFSCLNLLKIIRSQQFLKILGLACLASTTMPWLKSPRSHFIPIVFAESINGSSWSVHAWF